VTVYEVAAPPPVPGVITIVAPPSLPVTDAIAGAAGNFTFHCATRVEFAEPIVVWALAR
jgi:hypothetical protein